MADNNTHRLRRRTLLGVGLGASAGLIATNLSGCANETTVLSPNPGCLVTLDDQSDLRDQEQSANLAIIVGEAIRRGLSARAATIAITTALQESRLRNIDYGDRDSLGLFQQRPSQGWGTEEEIMDPWYSSGKFYEALVKVSDWQTGDINDVAQAVQRSGVPDGYAQHEYIGRMWASALYGYEPAGVTNVDRAQASADPEALRDLVVRVWGDGIDIVEGDSWLRFTTADARSAWSLALLLMCQGSAAGLTGLGVGTMSWTNDENSRASWVDHSDTADGDFIGIEQVVAGFRQ